VLYIVRQTGLIRCNLIVPEKHESRIEEKRIEDRRSSILSSQFPVLG